MYFPFSRATGISARGRLSEILGERNTWQSVRVSYIFHEFITWHFIVVHDYCNELGSSYRYYPDQLALHE